MRRIDRRWFSALVLGSLGSVRSPWCRRLFAGSPVVGRHGPLIRDRRKILDLPRGFSYQVISRRGEKMSDGFFVPAWPDGMGAFSGPDGLTVILRNHEWRRESSRFDGPFRGRRGLARKVPPEFYYDSGGASGSCLGSVTTLVYDTSSQQLRSQFLSLVGTMTNCSGGVTAWGTWISCEESCEGLADGYSQNHGYAFEVPVSHEVRLARPNPLNSMGRFAHEGVAYHASAGIAYQTEDRPDGLLYRFVPNAVEQSPLDGRLQALAVMNRPRFDSRNWGSATVSVGDRFPVHWIDLDDADRPTDDLRRHGYLRGAALFARGEGICRWENAVCFGCTTGGAAGKGQIWKYLPSPSEGDNSEAGEPAQLELLLESKNPLVLENPDQFCPTPWGDLLICEDGEGEQYLVGVTSEMEVYPFARNARDGSELAGACFSPDGSTLFLNNLGAGLTFAITGPW